jgi:hypothetical protein
VLYHFEMRRKILLVLSALILAGCCRDRYELVPIGENTAYRLDKQTGEVRLYYKRASFIVEAIEEETPAATTDERDVLKK